MKTSKISQAKNQEITVSDYYFNLSAPKKKDFLRRIMCEIQMSPSAFHYRRKHNSFSPAELIFIENIIREDHGEL